MCSLNRKARPTLRRGLMFAAAVLAAACNDTPAAVDRTPDPAGAEALGAATDASILAGMQIAIQDEYRAQVTYRSVLDAFGDVRPFSSIVDAEVRHAASLARLFVRRGLPVPANEWTSEDVPSFESLPAACAAGVVGEIENAAIYDAYLGMDLPADVRQVFQSNRDASIYNHLPAFQRCS